MKSAIKVLVLLVIMSTFSCSNVQQISTQQDNMSFQVFYDQLSPYGQWVNNSQYGYVWYPDVDYNFEPYSTDGQWVMTDYGWTWASDYDWGWAAFHYGRWDFDDNNGWFWVPGNEWGPSWVIWRQAEGYYGWTPMRPGVDISNSFSSGYNNINHWNFVRDRDFGRPQINHYYVNRNEYNTIIINSTVINNTYRDRSNNQTYISGPRRADVQRNSGRNVVNVTIRNSDRPGQKLSNNQLNIYRPKLDRNKDALRKSAPTRVTNATEIKPTRERNVNTNRNDNSLQNVNRGNSMPVPQKEIIRQPQQRPEERQPTEPERQVQQPEQRQPVQQTQPARRQEPVQQPVQRQEPVREPEPQRQQPVQPQSEPQRQQPVQQTQPTQRQEPVQQPVQRQEPVRQPEPQRQQPVQPQPEPLRQQPEPQRQQPVTQPEPQRQPQPQQPERQNRDNQQPSSRGEQQKSVQTQQPDPKESKSVNQRIKETQRTIPAKVTQTESRDNSSK